MNLITRRNVLHAGLAGSFVPFSGTAAAQGTPGRSATAVNPADLLGPSQPYSPDLEKYANDALSTAIVQIEKGTISSKDLLHAGKSLRLVTRNMHAQRIDLYVMGAVPTMDGDQVTPSEEQIGAVHSLLKQKGSTATLEQLQSSFQYSQTQVQAAKASLSKHGFTWHLHWVADRMYQVSRILNAGTETAGLQPKSQGVSAHLVSTEWRGHHPHLQRVQASSAAQACKKAICDLLSDSDTRTAIAAGIGVGLKAFGPTAANAFCASDIVLSTAADIVSVGAAIPATVAEAALCAGAQAAAQYAASAGGVIANTLLAKKGLEALAKDLGCSD